MTSPGMVHLVGAGPGDPGLLTVRGRACLEGCDAVVVDALASPRLLGHLREGAEVHHTGKRAGRHSATQDEINELLVRLAREGKDVVRLKGGDPFVFGRGGEECEVLHAAGVPFDVVPGITSAIAAPAYAGIPVTHRDWASHLTLVTGHEREGAGEARVDLARLGGLVAGGTLVFLMGARTLPRIVEGLTGGGADPATPAAAVMWGTDPRQRSVRSTLGGIVAAVAAAGLGAPMVTVVGRVAAMGAELDWFGDRPLLGRRVLVTRARAQASGFLERLLALGADAVELPVIAIEPATERADLQAALRALLEPAPPGGRFAVFTSANAADLVLAAVRELGLDARLFAGTTLVAIGPETARALAAGGLRADLVPGEFVAEAVAELMISRGVAGAQVLLPRAALARDVLPDRLREAGAAVQVLSLYRTVLPEGTGRRLREELARGPLDAVTFTSSSTVEHFRRALEGVPFPAGAIAACIGPVTARTARAAGFPVGLVAPEYTTAGLAAALAVHFGAGPT